MVEHLPLLGYILKVNVDLKKINRKGWDKIAQHQRKVENELGVPIELIVQFKNNSQNVAN